MIRYINIKILLTIIFCFNFNSVLFANDKIKENKKLSSSAEIGISILSGNTEEQSIYSDIESEYHKDSVTNVFRGKAENKKENKIRSREFYLLNNQVKYNFTKQDYSFIELEYLNDRYAGDDYRISENVGYGRNILKLDNVNLYTQVSIGLRQSRFTTQEKQNSWLFKISSKLTWDLTNKLVLKEQVNISFDDEVITVDSDTSLKVKINSKFYLRLGIEFKNKSQVPPGIKSTDTATRVNIGYDF